MEDSKIRVDRAAPEDLLQICRMESICFGDDAFSYIQLRYLILHSKGMFLVVRRGDKVCAYASYLMHDNFSNLRLYSIAVLPEERGYGYAKILIDKAVPFAKENNLSSISLEVRVDNNPAITLYEKNGFVKKSIIPSYYHDGTDAFRMVKLLY